MRLFLTFWMDVLIILVIPREGVESTIGTFDQMLLILNLVIPREGVESL